jgi:hypothetical protein
LVKFSSPFGIAASFGDKQLNNDEGLSPLNGVKGKPLSTEKVTLPLTSASLPGVVRPLSQSKVGVQSGAVEGFPSHISTYTGMPAWKPLATIVNATGFPAPSLGTTNGSGPGVGVVIAAYATPPNTTTQINATTAPAATRRPCPRIPHPALRLAEPMTAPQRTTRPA